MKKTLEARTIALCFGVAVVVLSWISFASYWSTRQLVYSFNEVTQTHQAIELIQHIEILMESAESSVRGYVIVGEDRRLDPYRYAKLVVPSELNQIEGFIKDYPRQQKTLRRLKALLEEHIDYLSRAVLLRRSQGSEAAAQWILNERDATKRNKMEHLLSEFQQEERKQLRWRWNYTVEHSFITKIVLLLAAGVSFALLVWVFSLLRHERTERQQAESATQRTETFLHSIVERIPYMISVKEAENLRLTLVNKAAEEWMGRSREDLLGSNEFDLRPKDEAIEALQKDRRVLQEGFPLDIPEDPLLLAGKERRVLHTQKIPLPDEQGNPAYLLSISEDITQRKQAEMMLQMSRDAAVESARMRSEFISNMSHEIRTPLSVIIGMTSLLLDTELSKDQHQFASAVQRAADGLSLLSKTILDFSKIEAGAFVLETREVHIQEIVDSVVSMLAEQAKAKGIHLASFLPGELPATLLGDPARLRQVLTQLAGNAVKFTPRGEIILRVSQAKETESQLWLHFRLSDTGMGIPPDKQKNLFQAFRQIDGSQTRKFGGTGLGLAISKRIVELMGGEIGMESAEGQGSTFWFTVPFNKAHVQGVGVQPPSPAWARARMLIVHESETSRQLLQQQLKLWALASEAVPSGQTALEILRHEQKAGRPFPIVLTDMDLPDMDAVVLARSLKQDPDLAQTKVLVMVSGTRPMEMSEASSLGFAGWVSKPPKMEELHERIASLIETPAKDFPHRV